ncbi:MAG: BREX-1 system phosphatase PglZ type B [Solirubrobacteraceae bacterium]
MTSVPEGTFLAALVAALQNAATANPGDQTRPAAVLWPDEARHWESLAPDLRAALPAFLTLGAYDPATATGPAIWLRAMIARALPEAEGWPEDAVPVLYLPSVGKNDLRAVESCPRDLQPLAELQYRGVLWVQRANSKDWTIEAFLTSARGGLDIKVQTDGATREALRNALPALARQPLVALRKEAPIRAAYLNHLLNPDLIHSLLRWMSDPEGERAAMDAARWTAFRSICREGYGFDPETEGALTAAAKLGERNGDWETVWNRYAQAAAHYPHIPDRLRSAPQPKQGTLFYRPECWPQENDAREAALRAALLALPTGDPVTARKSVVALEAEHGVRRTWVWATLGHAPLAHALDALSRLAVATGQPLKGGAVAPVVDAYIGGAWKADAAALDALASVGDTADVEAVKHAVDALYRVWLRDGAETFQQAVKQESGGYVSPVPSAEPTPGCCILFADGLRFDIGQRLADTLAARGLSAAVAPRLAALPTVTPHREARRLAHRAPARPRSGLHPDRRGDRQAAEYHDLPATPRRQRLSGAARRCNGRPGRRGVDGVRQSRLLRPQSGVETRPSRGGGGARTRGPCRRPRCHRMERGSGRHRSRLAPPSRRLRRPDRDARRSG